MSSLLFFPQPLKVASSRAISDAAWPLCVNQFWHQRDSEVRQRVGTYEALDGECLSSGHTDTVVPFAWLHSFGAPFNLLLDGGPPLIFQWFPDMTLLEADNSFWPEQEAATYISTLEMNTLWLGELKQPVRGPTTVKEIKLPLLGTKWTTNNDRVLAHSVDALWVISIFCSISAKSWVFFCQLKFFSPLIWRG